jgi:hypothetical protein
VGNTEVERTNYVRTESRTRGESILFPEQMKGDMTAHGNPTSHMEGAVVNTPNRKRGAPTNFKAASSVMSEYLLVAGQGTAAQQGAPQRPPQGASPETPQHRGKEGSAAHPPSTGKSLRRMSSSAAAQPAYGACAAPFWTASKRDVEATTVRPDADASKITQNFFSNSISCRSPAPFAVDGDRVAAPMIGQRYALSSRKWGLSERRGFNIVSNQDDQ